MLKLNGTISNNYDLYDTVALVITAPTVPDNWVVHQTAPGARYDYYATDGKEVTVRAEIKARNATYLTMEIPYHKVKAMQEIRNKDIEKGKTDIQYLFQMPIIPNNELWSISLDDVLQCPVEECQRPEKTVDTTHQDNVTRYQYQVPENMFTKISCDTSKYNYYIEKGKEKYGL